MPVSDMPLFGAVSFPSAPYFRIAILISNGKLLSEVFISPVFSPIQIRNACSSSLGLFVEQYFLRYTQTA